MGGESWGRKWRNRDASEEALQKLGWESRGNANEAGRRTFGSFYKRFFSHSFCRFKGEFFVSFPLQYDGFLFAKNNMWSCLHSAFLTVHIVTQFIIHSYSPISPPAVGTVK